jgi:hypothetical protein
LIIPSLFPSLTFGLSLGYGGIKNGVRRQK